MWSWWRAKRKARIELNERVDRVRELDRLPKPPYGYDPSWQAVLDGRREFAGSVRTGPWVGHDVFVTVWGPGSIGRSYQPEDFLWSADYWRTHTEALGPADGDPDANVVTLEEIYDFLGDHVVTWHSPLKSLERVGLMFGGNGRDTPG